MTGVADLRATCAASELPADQAAPEWVELLPTGKVRGRDGRVFIVDDPAAVVAASDVSGAELPIDYEHQADAPRGNGPVPAAGWVEELAVRDGAIWGRVKWTGKAANMIAAREYRYLSPVLLHDAQGRVRRLLGAGLVHRPNLNLKALASEDLPMTDDTDPPASAAIAEALGLEPDAPEADLVAAINSLRTPDPAKFVPLEAVQELIRAHGTSTVALNQERAEARVQAAMDRGYISPAMRDWALSLCTQDPQSFESFLAGAAPVFAQLGETHAQRPDRRARVLSGHGVSPDAEDIARTLGLPVEKVIG